MAPSYLTNEVFKKNFVQTHLSVDSCQVVRTKAANCRSAVKLCVRRAEYATSALHWAVRLLNLTFEVLICHSYDFAAGSISKYWQELRDIHMEEEERLVLPRLTRIHTRASYDGHVRPAPPPTHAPKVFSRIQNSMEILRICLSEIALSGLEGESRNTSPFRTTRLRKTLGALSSIYCTPRLHSSQSLTKK